MGSFFIGYNEVRYSPNHYKLLPICIYIIYHLQQGAGSLQCIQGVPTAFDIHSSCLQASLTNL